jgi:hypothetical protein
LITDISSTSVKTIRKSADHFSLSEKAPQEIKRGSRHLAMDCRWTSHWPGFQKALRFTSFELESFLKLLVNILSPARYRISSYCTAIPEDVFGINWIYRISTVESSAGEEMLIVNYFDT